MPNKHDAVRGDEMVTITEKLATITPEEFGYRIAKVFCEDKSSTAIFFIQQAFRDCEDDNGIMWKPFKEMFERFQRREIAAARDREGKLMEALEHYADEKNWDTSSDTGIYDDLYNSLGNGYDIAQKALAAAAEQAEGG